MRKKMRILLDIKPLSVNKGWFKDTGKKSKKRCLVCNSIFEYYLSTANKKYCSKKCYYLSRKGKPRPDHSVFMKKYSNEHNTGKRFLGRIQSISEKENTSKRIKERWKNKDDKFNSQEYRQKLSDYFVRLGKLGKLNMGHSRGKQGWYKNGDKKYYMRSSWERNYARYLDFLIKQRNIKNWEYEIDTFWFERIKRGVRSYKPDFKVYNNNGTIEYHEVKGWLDNKSKTKLNRMRIYYPSIKIILIEKKQYNAVKQYSRCFSGWE
jgi:hypothetical protein